MATAHGYEEADDRGTTPRSSKSRTSGATWKGATAGISTAALLDIVERLGLVDMVVGRVKERLDDIDIDQLIDDASDYVRRNPEVLVVALGAVTIATGALVYLSKRSGGSRLVTQASGSTPATHARSPKSSRKR